MKARPLFLSFLGCALLAGCGGSTQSCMVAANVTPAAATADHTAAAPGNQAQFMLMSSVTGNCLLRPDPLGTWSTSDPVNTTLGSVTSTSVVATCVNATASPATISNSGTVNGHLFQPAALACR
jgi:hypothetical protein